MPTHHLPTIYNSKSYSPRNIKQAMQGNHWIAATMLGAAAGLAVGAYYVGPPVSYRYPDQALVATASPPPAALMSEEISIDSFGVVPQCHDEITIRTVVGILRQHTFVRILGLTNVTDADHSPPGNRVCQAVVELGQRGRVSSPVRYGIITLERHNTWQITLYPNRESAFAPLASP